MNLIHASIAIQGIATAQRYQQQGQKDGYQDAMNQIKQLQN